MRKKNVSVVALILIAQISIGRCRQMASSQRSQGLEEQKERERCPSARDLPSSNEHDARAQKPIRAEMTLSEWAAGSRLGGSKEGYGNAWQLEARKHWKSDAFTDPNDFDTSETFRFLVHSFRIKSELWNYRNPDRIMNVIHHEHATSRLKLIKTPEESMGKRLLSISVVDQSHLHIFHECAGWIIEVKPSAIFATAQTDMALTNAYADKLLRVARSKECFAVLCGGDGSKGKSICDELRAHLLEKNEKFPIVSPEELLQHTKNDGYFPYNEIAVMGTSPEDMSQPKVVGVLFGVPEYLRRGSEGDCAALQSDLRSKAQQLGIPIVQLRAPSQPVVTSQPTVENNEREDEDQRDEILTLEKKIARLEALQKRSPKNPSIGPVIENLRKQLSALKG